LNVKMRFAKKQNNGFLRATDASMALNDLCRRQAFSEVSYVAKKVRHFEFPCAPRPPPAAGVVPQEV
jgi:hypothetical protein